MSELTFYHGTRRGFKPGGYVMPQAFHGGATTTAPLIPGKSRTEDSTRWTYVTTSKIVAWVYAWCAMGRGKPKVLRVQPIGFVESDPEHSPSMQAYRCEMARVLAVETDSPITEQEAREGWQA